MCMVVGELTELSAIVSHPSAPVVRDRHKKICRCHIARQHYGSGPAGKRCGRQCLLRRTSVPRQRPPLRNLRQRRHAGDDRRRRGAARNGGARSWAATKTIKRCKSCLCRSASLGCRQPCATAAPRTTSARCGSSLPKRYAPDRRRSEFPDFDHAVRRHRMLDAIVRASQTGQRQKVAF